MPTSPDLSATKKGFILIELLVVISIIAILTTVLISLQITDKMLEYS